jgi:hypothetical protein
MQVTRILLAPHSRADALRAHDVLLDSACRVGKIV